MVHPHSERSECGWITARARVVVRRAGGGDRATFRASEVSLDHRVGVRPDKAAGWRIVSWEKCPDDDVDAVFSDGRNSVDLEVFCNRGRPTLAEPERNTLGDD